MRAMVLTQARRPLEMTDVPVPQPAAGEVRIRVNACGVCRTDLHVVDGELTEPALPLIPGHQIVGRIDAVGDGVSHFSVGQRVGVPWLGGSCGHCGFCNSGRENLCDDAVYTGYQRNGGFAEYCTANADYCFELPGNYPDRQVAPLLCAGLIGYRCYRIIAEADPIGLYGFGAAAHILLQVACHQGKTVYAFTRDGDAAAQDFARRLGADWAGASGDAPPRQMEGSIIFAPVGGLVPTALAQTRKGGTVVCGGIHMSDIPSFPYRLLWGERTVTSVANLTRRDGEEFLPLAAAIPVRTETHHYALDEANRALDDLRAGRFTGAAVIEP